VQNQQNRRTLLEEDNNSTLDSIPVNEESFVDSTTIVGFIL